MNFIDAHLLSLILFVPAIAAVVILFLPDNENKLIQLFVCYSFAFILNSHTESWPGNTRFQVWVKSHAHISQKRFALFRDLTTVPI